MWLDNTEVDLEEWSLTQVPKFSFVIFGYSEGLDESDPISDGNRHEFSKEAVKNQFKSDNDPLQLAL